MEITAVRTTGIFCRAGCPAPAPRPENVEMMNGARDALFAGYRPCRRCHPLDGPGAPLAVREAVAAVESRPDERRRGGDPLEAAAWFEREHAMTLAAYRRARRLTETIRAARRARRQRPADGRVVIRLIETPLGPMLAGATNDGVCLLEFTDRPMLPTQLDVVRRRHGAMVAGRHPHLDQLATELDEYFAARRTTFDVPIDAPGSPFQQTVWERLLAIPSGSTASYAGLADALGRPGAARAVGRANGSNRVAIVIPCHRVVAADGGLGGYGGGLDRKRWLLDLEWGTALPAPAPLRDP